MPSITAPVFVGRSAHLDRLNDAAARAAEGEPSIILVAGEAGVGKTRLVDEAAGRLEIAGWRRATGHCIDLAADHSPYTPIMEAFRDVGLVVEPLDLAGFAPLGAAPRDDLVGATGRSTLFASFMELLDRSSRDAPLLFVLEDLHWADPSTRDAIRYFARALRRERVLVIGTYRSDELHRTHPWLATVTELGRLARVERLGVERFDRTEVAELVASLLGRAPSDELIERIHVRSDGNAFYVEELVASGVESEVGHVPPTVSDIIGVRMARLSRLAHAVADIAAVAGRRVQHELLAALSGLEADELTTGLRELVDARILLPVSDPLAPGYEFRHALAQEAVYDDLLPSERRAIHGAIARWLATHDDPARPRITHLTDLEYHVEASGDRAGALRLSVEAADEAVRVLAYEEAQVKYECALDLWQDVPDPEGVAGITQLDLLERAADAAGAAADFIRAIAFNRAALELLGPDGDPARRTRRYDRMAWCQWDLGEAEAAERTLREAMAALPRDQPRWKARLLSALAHQHWSAARHRDGVAAAREALAAAQAADDPIEEGWARMILGATLAGSGDSLSGVAELETAAILLRYDEGIDNVVTALTEALQLAGRHEDAIQMALEAIERAQGAAGSRRRYVPYFLANLCDSLVQLGRYREIGRYLDTVDWPRNGGRSSTWLFQSRANVEIASGDLMAARQALEAGAARFREGAAYMDWFWQRSSETELALAEGRLEDAHRIAHHAIESSPDPTHDSILWRFIVLALRADADLAERAAARRGDAATIDDLRSGAAALVLVIETVADEARVAGRLTPMLETYERQVAAERSRVDGRSDPDAWTEVAEAAERAGFRPNVAYAAFREAEAALRQDGPSDRVVGSLAKARAVAGEIGDVPLLQQIDDLARRGRIDELRSPDITLAAADRVPEDTWGLSSREREVLALLAEGRTNRQIGEALFISDKTASVHVTHILDKMGVSSRTEAALLAARAGVSASAPAPTALTLEPPAP